MAEPTSPEGLSGATRDPERPSALLLDIDGVLVVSWKALPGALDAMAAVRRASIPVRFLTNTTSRPRTAVVEALRTAGFRLDEDEVVTAPIATAAYLRQHFPGATAALLCSGDVRADLATSGATLVDLTAGEVPERADVVVMGGAGPEFGYEALNRAFGLLLHGATLVAMHRGLSWRTSAGMQLDSGAFLAGLERAAQVQATVIGKPEAAMFAGALAGLGVGPGGAVMIGDDIDSDVRGAQSAGLRGALVRTGKFRPQVLGTPGSAPDMVCDDLGTAIAMLGITE